MRLILFSGSWAQSVSHYRVPAVIDRYTGEVKLKKKNGIKQLPKVNL